MKTTNYRQLDLSYLEETAMGSDAFMQEMIEIFLEDAPMSLRIMQEACANGDLNLLKQEVHKLKPNLTMMGMNHLSSAVEAVEDKAQNSNADIELSELINYISTEIQFEMAELKRILVKRF